MKELTEIANKCGTDKGTDGEGDSMSYGMFHGYTEFYDDYFKKIRDTNKKIYVLEIGVFHGKSLQMYNEYFHGNCEIYGIDIDDKSEYDSENIHTFIVDQGNQEQLDEFRKKMETDGIKFDIILDDGSHVPPHQQISLLTLHSLLNEGGIYIIEDVHTSYSMGILNFDKYNSINYGTLYFLDTFEYRNYFNSIDDYYHLIASYKEIIKYSHKTKMSILDEDILTNQSITVLIQF